MRKLHELAQNLWWSWRPELRSIFLLLDARRTPSGQDIQMHEWTTSAGIDERIVLTKSDKLSNNELIKSSSEIAQGMGVDPAELIAASTVTKKGIDQIRREMLARM